jgi:hypothetical protein
LLRTFDKLRFKFHRRPPIPSLSLRISRNIFLVRSMKTFSSSMNPLFQQSSRAFDIFLSLLYVNEKRNFVASQSCGIQLRKFGIRHQPNLFESFSLRRAAVKSE